MRTLIAALVAMLMFDGCAQAPTSPSSLRLYVLDCGTLHIGDPTRFNLKREEVATTDLSMACVLVAHPKGTLMWDTGGLPDAEWTPTGASVRHRLVLPGGAGERELTLRKRLSDQLAEIGYPPRNITYLALSHYHFDHTSNANAFSGATWLVRQSDRDAMFAEKAPLAARPDTYARLRDAKTLIVKGDDHDVFGDGSVVLKSTPGHTPGHQSLLLKLPKTGPVLLSGDLYHFRESRTLQRVPSFDFDQERSRATRAAVESFLKQTSTAIWIQHDATADAQLRKAPQYYE
jgi:glyoxylase-like metal-dependent hydrolase (beta-lactamase superfamily II)